MRSGLHRGLMDGPPFSIDEHEVKRHYGGVYELNSVESKCVADGLKGKIPSTETVWLLQRTDK
ncbi:MAG: thiopurine S-methyltransferase, partial [Methylomonas sp.]